MSPDRARTRLLWAAVLALSCAHAGAPAGENGSFGAEPAGGGARRAFHAPAEGGAPAIARLRVYSRAREPIGLLVYATSARMGARGVIEVGARGAIARSRVRGEASLRLAPGEDRNVELELRPLADGSLEAIVVEQAPGPSGGSIDLVQRIAILVTPAGAAAAGGAGAALPQPWVIVVAGVLLAGAWAIRGRRGTNAAGRARAAGKPAPPARAHSGAALVPIGLRREETRVRRPA